MWLLVLVTLAVNGGNAVYSNVHTLSGFPSETQCQNAASILEKISLSAPDSNGAKLVTTAKCVVTGSRR
jgi:hypothetical protein